MVIFPCAVQHILVTYFIYSSLHLLIYLSCNCPSLFLLPSGNHKLFLYIYESISVLLSSFVYLFFRLYISVIM